MRPPALALALAAAAATGLLAAGRARASPSPEGASWAPCSFAVDQLAAEGNGSAYGSCLGCDPTSFVCPSKCQALIDALYAQCAGVYAPQDHFFDPAGTLGGYWDDSLDALRVMAARCGCSTASARVAAASLGTLTLALAAAAALPAP